MQRRHLFSAVTAIALLSGCTAIQGETPALFDLGTRRAAASPQSQLLAGRAISVAEVAAPAWLDSEQIYYRLNYANAQQPRPYATSRWTMSPGQLLGQRARQDIAQAGGVALAAADAAAGVPMLRIQLDDFSQHFTTPERSTGRVALRATLFDRHRVIGQRSFEAEAPAPSANAEGGVRALAQASDAVLADVMDWLSKLQQK